MGQLSSRPTFSNSSKDSARVVVPEELKQKIQKIRPWLLVSKVKDHHGARSCALMLECSPYAMIVEGRDNGFHKLCGKSTTIYENEFNLSQREKWIKLSISLDRKKPSHMPPNTDPESLKYLGLVLDLDKLEISMKQVEITTKNIEIPKKPYNPVKHINNSLKWCCTAAAELQKYQVQPTLVKRTKRSMRRLYSQIVSTEEEQIEKSEAATLKSEREARLKEVKERHEQRTANMVANTPKRQTKEHEQLMLRMRRAVSADNDNQTVTKGKKEMRKSKSLEGRQI